MRTNNAYFHFPTKGKYTNNVRLLEIAAQIGAPLKLTRMENMFPENGVIVDQGALKIMMHYC